MGMGNKGAVALRFRIFDSSMLLFCCHLPSGESEAELNKRNWALTEILKRATFQQVPDGKYQQGDIYRSLGVPTVVGAGEGDGQWWNISHFEDHEHIVLLGDMNYRVNALDDVAIDLIRSNELNQLLLKDQLVNEMEKKTILQGWTEGILTFPPTYKFVKGTQLYHGEFKKPTEESKSVRTPSWTDRIIFKTSGGLHQLNYSSGEKFILSDHKPVYAAFLTYVTEFNPRKVAKAIDLARKSSDAQENASIPEVVVSPQNIDFGEILYGEDVNCKIILQNRGQQPAVFVFIPPPDVRGICPSWMKVKPKSSLIDTQQQVEVKLTVNLVGGVAEDIVMKHGRQMEAILVLRVKGGRDFFVCVTGTYKPSFFGLTFNTMRKITPQADPSIPEYEELLLSIPQLREEQAVLDKMPWQVKALSSALLAQEALSTQGIFVRSQAACEVHDYVLNSDREPKDTKKVRLLLEKGKPLDSCEPHAVAATILLLFKMLPSSFMPQAIVQMCNVIVPSMDHVEQLLLQEMSEEDQAVLRHTLRFMRCVLFKSHENGVYKKQLARSIAGVWFPPVHDPSEEGGHGSSETIQERLRISDHIWSTRTELIILLLQYYELAAPEEQIAFLDPEIDNSHRKSVQEGQLEYQ